ncbi:tRNA(Met) cytidine acetyltransferase TmcA [Marinobacter sp.]|uniref:tRNA(Met) cytidine acetyltransferase TmcA n=1 Tax=Marinobacter sp. TaxID=50741 RepID=UPI003850C87F
MAAATPSCWRNFQQSLQAAGQRRLVLVEGSREEALSWLGNVLPELVFETGLWSGPATGPPHPGLTAIRPDAGRRWLGREIQLLVWDGWQGNPPDSLAALSGTLAAGGLWFWLMPPLDTWGEFADPDYARTGLEEAGHHPFAERMARVIASDPSVIRVSPGAEPELSGPPSQNPPFVPGGTADQAKAVREVLRTARGRARRPLVITADRGRGKSAALGMAAVEYLKAARQPAPETRVIVTAPGTGAVRTLFEHARLAAGAEAVPGRDEFSLVLSGGQTLSFYAVDELLRHRPEAGLVLVDEAAAIPAPLLEKILGGWPRVVYATTTHGYEGSGRGFALRFRRVLEKKAPRWQSLQLHDPVRWAEGDPLEALVRELFLLAAESPVVEASGPVTLSPWRPAEATEGELAAAFGLLVDAHYRTTPGDLRQWMDDPRGQSWLARSGAQVVGVLWMTVEGGLDPELAQQVALGERRLRGHLLPQSLANHSGFPAAACLRLARVVRVAVHERWRRQGVGIDLVLAAGDHARAGGLDGLGTSFGVSPDLLGFWQRCGFELMRLGLQREASSGEHAVQMLIGFSDEGKGLAGQIRARFAEHWPVLLPRVWPDLAPELVLSLTGALTRGAELDALDEVELEAFCHGHRGLELSLLPMMRLSMNPGVAGRLLSLPDKVLWCRAVLQNWSWQQLQASGDCLGRRDGESRLRALAAELWVGA